MTVKIIVYYNRFLNYEGKKIEVGGIETMLRHLSSLFFDLGYSIEIFQIGTEYFNINYKGAKVIGLPFPPNTPISDIVKKFRRVAISSIRTKDYIEIFGADHFSIPCRNPRAISIQHGISWDQSINQLTKKRIFYTRVGEKIFRIRWYMKALRYFENCRNRVCVDLNFINWYRTIRANNFKGNIWFNPNPVSIVPWNKDRENNKRNTPIRILFARRLLIERGTRVAGLSIKKLLDLKKNIEVTFAGDGPEKEFLKKLFSNDNRVSFCKYSSEDSVGIHKKYDIAIVPSLASEGTSFSVVEAMAAGCAVIASNVGGITNQIIDGYNGFLVWPTEKSLLEALIKVIDSPSRRLSIQKHAWETSQEAFGIDRWRSRWENIIGEVISGGIN